MPANLKNADYFLQQQLFHSIADQMQVQTSSFPRHTVCQPELTKIYGFIKQIIAVWTQGVQFVRIHLGIAQFFCDLTLTS